MKTDNLRAWARLGAQVRLREIETERAHLLAFLGQAEGPRVYAREQAMSRAQFHPAARAVAHDRPLHWTQRPENAARVSRLVRRMRKAKANVQSSTHSS